MKPFDLEAAMRGEPLVTRDGRKAKFVAYVQQSKGEKVIALIDGDVFMFFENGCYCREGEDSDDLFMAPTPMLSINGHEFPEPVREPLKEGQGYWLVDLTAHTGVVSYANWDGEECEFRWLDRGLIQLTEEGARQQLKAMIAALGGIA